MLMMRPLVRNRREASRNVLKTPLRLMVIWRSNRASSLSAIVASCMMPALLTTTSMPPNAASAVSNRRATAGGIGDIGLRGDRAASGAPDLRHHRFGGAGVAGIVD